MNSKLSKKDMVDAKQINEVFSNLCEEDKTIVCIYLSALRDKQLLNDSSDKKVS